MQQPAVAGERAAAPGRRARSRCRRPPRRPGAACRRAPSGWTSRWGAAPPTPSGAVTVSRGSSVSADERHRVDHRGSWRTARRARLQHLPQPLGARRRVARRPAARPPGWPAHSAGSTRPPSPRSRRACPWTSTACRSTATAAPPGRSAATPARSQSAGERRRARPGPPSAGPNIVPTHAAKIHRVRGRLGDRPAPVAPGAPPPRAAPATTAGSTSGVDHLAAQRRSARRPAATGSSPATVERHRRRPGGARPSASRPHRPALAAAWPAFSGPQPLHQVAGVDQHRAGGLAHAVDRAGVDRRRSSYSSSSSRDAARCRRAASARCISRRSTIRCRGVVVRSWLGQTGSQ